MVGVENEKTLHQNNDEEVIGTQPEDQHNHTNNSESSTDVTTSTSNHHHNNNEKEGHAIDATGDNNNPAIQQLTVEELYDKDKYDLSTMEPGDVFVLLQ